MHVFHNKQNEPESCGAAQQLHPQVVDPYEIHLSEILRAFFIQGPYNFFMNRAAHIAKPRQIWATSAAGEQRSLPLGQEPRALRYQMDGADRD